MCPPIAISSVYVRSICFLSKSKHITGILDLQERSIPVSNNKYLPKLCFGLSCGMSGLLWNLCVWVLEPGHFLLDEKRLMRNHFSAKPSQRNFFWMEYISGAL